MNKLFSLFWLVMLTVSIFSGVGLAANPKPLADDFILPMPDGKELVFRPVFLGTGGRPFAMKEFTAGQSTGDFKEFPTPVTVGGSFKKNNANNTSDWLYYLGKYEVTEAQYYAIMQPGTHKGSQQPITRISWVDAVDFINKYNLWLYENAIEKLPENNGTPGFIRLPTEAEWEFAARGGSVVDKVTFDKKTSYDGQLSKYEWFSGPKSSHGKIKKIGLLKPNPIGLHDMLGNAAELTSSQFMLEYYQGRVGGFVVKGGSCITPEKNLRTSLRSEISFYQKKKGKMVPSSQPVLGLRLIIASPVFDSRMTFKELEEAWPEYQKSRKPPVLAGQGNASQKIREKLLKQIAELKETVAELQESLKTARIDPSASHGIFATMMAKLNNVTAKFNKVFVINKNLNSNQVHNEISSAHAWIRVATGSAYMIVFKDIAEIPKKKKAISQLEKYASSKGSSKMQATIKDIKEQLVQANKNLIRVSETILTAYKQLKILDDPASVPEGLKNFKTELQTRSGLDRQTIDAQIRMADLIMQHYRDYIKNGKLDGEHLIADLKAFQL